jgi:pyruvate,orthophosphate dikinase
MVTQLAAATFVPYGQGHGRGLTAAELGTHGVEMDGLVGLGLPTVPGITIPVASSIGLSDPNIAARAIELVEELTNRRVGDAEHPLLLRLVASAPVTASALPPDIAMLGTCPANVDALVALIGRRTELYAAWSRMVAVLAEGGRGVDPETIEDIQFDVPDPVDQIPALFAACVAEAGSPFPETAAAQVALAAQTLLSRWASPRGQRARKSQGLPADLGLALHLQSLRIGRWEDSGYGVATSRDSETGAFAPSGSFYRGVRRSATEGRQQEPLEDLPGGVSLLTHALTTLEHHLHDVATVEFEVRDNQLALLTAARTAASPRAVARLAVELAAAGTTDRRSAVLSFKPKLISELMHAQLKLTGSEPLLVEGLGASPGAASGVLVLTSERAVELGSAGVPAVLVMDETSPADVPGMLAAAAIVTSRGGLASHAAVVARSAGKPAVCGATALRFDARQHVISAGGHTLHEGDVLSVDGRSGRVYAARADVQLAEPPAELNHLLGWADDIRRMRVRANADTAVEARVAMDNGAEGIGLCRTEHQFLGARLPLVRRFLLAGDEQEETSALDGLIAAQREDFVSLFAAVGAKPVTVRLLDAPLHEFLPHDSEYESAAQAATAADMHESNPMLGLRGVRLALVRERLYPAQAVALFMAWLDTDEQSRPQLEVMIPLVALPAELDLVSAQVAQANALVHERTGVIVPYRFGSMIETPRAALLAGRFAEYADFLSFGTNDLTQLTYGFSRDDVERSMLVRYKELGLLAASPFAELDSDGVLELIALACQRARAVRPDIKLGICGEHGGDHSSIALLESLQLDYVSCSPQRVPVARLAAAHSTMEQRRNGGLR